MEVCGQLPWSDQLSDEYMEGAELNTGRYVTPGQDSSSKVLYGKLVHRNSQINQSIMTLVPTTEALLLASERVLVLLTSVVV